MPALFCEEGQKIMLERFGHDSLIALATSVENVPSVRTVNALFIDDSFYVITHARSNKMLQIAANPIVAVSGDWFTAHGIAESLGHILLPANAALADALRAAFASWYQNGHTDESDPNTIILRIRLTSARLLSHGTLYQAG